MGKGRRECGADGLGKKEMKKVLCWIYFCKRFLLLFSCFNVNCGENWNLWCVRKKTEQRENEGKKQQVILMKIGFGLRVEVLFWRFSFSSALSMSSLHKSDLIKKLLAFLLSFSLALFLGDEKIHPAGKVFSLGNYFYLIFLFFSGI
jgi:hypothetical protein